MLLLISRLLLNALSHRLVSVCIVNLRCEMVNKRIKGGSNRDQIAIKSRSNRDQTAVKPRSTRVATRPQRCHIAGSAWWKRGPLWCAIWERPHLLSCSLAATSIASAAHGTVARSVTVLCGKAKSVPLPGSIHDTEFLVQSRMPCSVWITAVVARCLKVATHNSHLCVRRARQNQVKPRSNRDQTAVKSTSSAGKRRCNRAQ